MGNKYDAASRNIIGHEVTGWLFNYVYFMRFFQVGSSGTGFAGIFLLERF